MILESLGFTATPVARPRPPVPVPAAPIPTAVSSVVPVRSTTALVEELWEVEEPLGEFPPPVEPAIAATTGRWSWIRAIVTVLVLGVLGLGAHLATTYALDVHADGVLADTEVALADVRDHAELVHDAAAAIANPEADDVVLSTAAAAITSLEDDARALRSLANPEPGWPEAIGVTIVDPVAGRRSAASVVADRAAAVADRLSIALTTRLLTEQIPPLPDLPSGADDATIDELEATLTAAITTVRADAQRYDPALAEAVAPVIDGWEDASVAYIGALRSHDPDAEAHAGEVVAAHEVLGSAVAGWLERLGPELAEAAERYRTAVRSIG